MEKRRRAKKSNPLNGVRELGHAPESGREEEEEKDEGGKRRHHRRAALLLLLYY